MFSMRFISNAEKLSTDGKTFFQNGSVTKITLRIGYYSNSAKINPSEA
jgi:hypothetical protein